DHLAYLGDGVDGSPQGRQSRRSIDLQADGTGLYEECAAVGTRPRGFAQVRQTAVNRLGALERRRLLARPHDSIYQPRPVLCVFQSRPPSCSIRANHRRSLAMADYGDYEFLNIAVADRIATVTINRPDRLNAVHNALHHELEQIWIDVRADQDVNAIILT